MGIQNDLTHCVSSLFDLLNGGNLETGPLYKFMELNIYLNQLFSSFQNEICSYVCYIYSLTLVGSDGTGASDGDGDDDLRTLNERSE